MTPTEAIESLHKNLLAEVNRLHAQLADEVDDIEELWTGLGRAGGQRDDHAAAMLCALSPHLSGIAAFCGTCNQQISDMSADPFGRKDGVS